MRLGIGDLRSRMTLMFVGLLLLVQIATLSLTNHLEARLAGEQFLPVLERAEATAAKGLSQANRALSRAGAAIAGVGGLGRAAASSSPEAASRILREQAQRHRVDLVVLADSSGRVLASSGTDSALPPDTSIQIDTSAEAGNAARPRFLLDSQGMPFLIVTVPISAGARRGVVAVGRRVDESLLREQGLPRGLGLSMMTRREGGQWKLAASTRDVKRDAGIERQLARELGVAGFLEHASPLEPREFQTRIVKWPTVGGDSAAVLQQPLGGAMATFETLRLAVSLVTPLGMLIFVLGSNLVAASITRPVREFARVAGLIRVGDYSQPIRAGARGEIAELANSLDSMREEVARREDEVRRLAYFDPLTGLANRARFSQALRDAITMAGQPTDDLRRARLVVFLLDLDRFKWVNDTLGHDYGDRVLKAAAARLRGALPESATVARLGGDEFAVLVSGTERPAYELVDRITQALEPPIAIDDHSVDISASIGIAHFPEHGASASELLRHADSAMYTAKRHGVASAVFDTALETHRVEHLSMLSDLRGAIARQELEMYVQPKVSLDPGSARMAGEVLVRWQHPERGMLPPSDFIPFAEQTGFIRQMTVYLLPRAIAQAAAWLREGIEVSLAVNVSTRDLEDRLFAQRVVRWLAAESLPARLLCLEVTETALMEEPEHAMEVLRHLRTIGVQLAIDDYGTGLSSLAYLKTLLVNELKIDKSFVRAMQESERDATIVRSTIELGHSLGMKVTAEGVETTRQAEILREFGCDSAQGYLYLPAVPVAQFESWMRLQRPAAANHQLAATA